MNSTGETSMKKNGTLKPTFAEILRRPPLRRGTDIRRAPIGRDPEGDRETRQSKLGVEELDYFQNRWEIINRGVAKIKNIAQGLPGAKFTSEEYMNLYATMYHCGSVRKQLDEKYMDTCEDHVKATVLPSLRKKSDEFMLRDLVQRWTTHQLMVRWLLRFFDYENHNDIHVPYSKLKVAGLTIFRAMVYQELKAKLADAVISVIDRAREGEQVHWDLLTNVLDIFIGNGAGYRTYEGIDLENSILKGSAAYYLRKASKWMVEYSCPNYILKVEECLKREDDLFYHIVHLVSRGNLRTKLKHELLSAYATMLENENTGCNVLLRNEKVRDLSTIFRCLPQIPRGLEIVSNSFKLHVTARCTALVKQAENSANKKAVKRDGGGLREHVFVRGVIELHDKFLGYVNGCFENHLLFHKALKEAFIILCSKGVSGSSNAELFASFCDNILQKGENERLSSKAITDTLEKVVKLLAYINDKDLFAEFYRKRLSRRLLFDKSSNLELERSILTRLKQEFGVLFTSKMEGMVTDFTLARENQIMFKEYLRPNPYQNASPGIDLAVTVLTTGFWPTYKTFDLNLPAEMATCVCAYKEFYLTNTKHRKLTFIYSLGTCNVNGRFDEKTIELNVTTYQAATLLLFNTSDRLSYREIVTQLNLPDDDVVRLLHSLSCGRYKILSKQPDTKTISPTDTFEYNSKFTDKMRRIKIPIPPVVVDEKKKVIEDVNKDRRYSIDASIVRIMKSRKVLGYQQLISECVEQLSCTFKPDVKAIKKRIEDLIELEFLERDEDNPSIFKYLA